MTDEHARRGNHRALMGRVAPARKARPRAASPLETASGRIAFIVAGSLLAASAVLELLGAYSLAVAIPLAAFGRGDEIGGLPAIGEVLGRAMFAAAVVLFAVGLRGGGSIVARRPVGMIALIVCGLASLAVLIGDLIPGAGGEWFGGAHWVFLAAGLVGAIEIVRVRAISGRTRFLPLALALSHLLLQLGVVWVLSAPAEGWSQLGYAALLVLVGVPAVALLTLAIGICALVAGIRARSAQGEPNPAEAGPTPVG